VKLVEKYRPKLISEMIGQIEKFEEAREYIKSNFPVILCGRPGIGKTTAAYAIANELNLSVSETNMSDARTTDELKRIGNTLASSTIIPTLFLLDEVDGVRNHKLLEKIIKNSMNPVIMTANEKMKLGMSLKKYCKFIEVYPPNTGEIAKLIKKIAKSEGITEFDYSRISRDVRSSINATFGKSNPSEEEINDFERTKLAFKERMVSSIEPIWLLDNVHNFYHGIDVYRSIQLIQYMIETGDPIFISSFPESVSGKPTFPNFLRRK